MTHSQKPDFIFRRNGRVHLNRRGRQFSRLLAAEVCASAGVILDTPCSEVVWRVLATHSIRQFPLHFPSRASPCAITFQLESTRIGQDESGDQNNSWHDFRLPPRCKWGLRSSRMLHSVNWYFVTKVSGQYIRPIFSGQTAQEKSRERSGSAAGM